VENIIKFSETKDPSTKL